MNKKEIQAIVKAAGGSTLTKNARSACLTATARELKKDLNIQLKSFAGLKTQHMTSLVDRWKSQGNSIRTINNKLAHVRTALRELDREKFADSKAISNAALGASGASRAGTHSVPDKNLVIERLNALPEPFRAAAELQLSLGLRAQEAIQANQSLQTWKTQIENNRPVLVLHGTKGGRARAVQLTEPKMRERAYEAVKAAIQVAEKQDGKIVPSATLEGATRAYQRAMSEVGFKGREASHSLRYIFAREQFAEYMAEFNDKKEALSALSLDLGHGDGRGRYCEYVYLK